jgi:ketosteroid isomerase-like protein
MRLSFLFAATSLAAAPLAMLAGCSEAPAGGGETPEAAAAMETPAAETDAGEAAIIDAATAADLVRQVAESYDDWEAFDIRQPPFALTPRLDALLAAERDYVDEHGEPRMLDFDWHVGGQDAEISNLSVSHEAVEPGMVIVTASFDNFGTPTRINYVWMQQDDGSWALDDATIDDPDGNILSLGALLSNDGPY